MSSVGSASEQSPSTAQYAALGPQLALGGYVDNSQVEVIDA